MKHQYITAAHSLRLVPVSQIQRLAQDGTGCATVVSFEKPISAAEIPGTVLVSSEEDDNNWLTKQITFKRRIRDKWSLTELEILRSTHLVAIYTDPTGEDRLAGTINNPLSLTYVEEGGVCNCTLTGTNLTPDLYLTD